MKITIRQELPEDYTTVEKLIKTAFAEMELSDQTEHRLVANLRKSGAFIPELSLVAEFQGRIVGHIILTGVFIKNGEQKFPSLALAPVSVHPNFHKKGIGGKLITESHRIAASLGYSSITLLGHPEYYPRFGYKKTSEYKIRMPFEAPEEACMILELHPGALDGVSGEVVYSAPFFA